MTMERANKINKSYKIDETEDKINNKITYHFDQLVFTKAKNNNKKKVLRCQSEKYVEINI